MCVRELCGVDGGFGIMWVERGLVRDGVSRVMIGLKDEWSDRGLFDERKVFVIVGMWVLVINGDG